MILMILLFTVFLILISLGQILGQEKTEYSLNEPQRNFGISAGYFLGLISTEVSYSITKRFSKNRAWELKPAIGFIHESMPFSDDRIKVNYLYTGVAGTILLGERILDFGVYSKKLH